MKQIDSIKYKAAWSWTHNSKSVKEGFSLVVDFTEDELRLCQKGLAEYKLAKRMRGKENTDGDPAVLISKTPFRNNCFDKPDKSGRAGMILKSLWWFSPVISHNIKVIPLTGFLCLLPQNYLIKYYQEKWINKGSNIFNFQNHISSGRRPRALCKPWSWSESS